MAWYWYVLIGAGVLVVLSLLWKGKSWWARQNPSGRRLPGASPSLTLEEGKEIKEETSEKANAERAEITKEQDEIKEQVDEWLEDLE